MNLPNALSLLRIFSVPVLIWLLLNNHMEWSLWLFLMASFSDGLDGWIAKRFQMQTVLGAFLDPIADKLLLVSAYITLSVVDRLPLWLTLVVVSRDVVIIVGALVYQMVTGALRMEPLLISKFNTVVQLFVVMLTLANGAYAWQIEQTILTGTWLVAVTSISSGLAYIFKWGRRASDVEQSGRQV